MATAAQRQQALLAHASRLNTLGEMASGLVHEINQPVTAITLYTEACLARLRRGDIDPEETRDLVEKIASQSTRANAIIQHIRRFARQGKPQYTVNPVGEMLTEISDFLELETRRHGVRIGYDIAPDLPAALADRLQVQQVVCNLVRNAVDATAASTSLRLVTILARAAEAQIEIAVCDSGPGLKPEEMEQLMHPFFTTKPEGLGLGLPISQSIVEAHGGRLWATVNLDSPGMTFHFTLPVAGSAEPRTQRPVHALESNRAGRV
jgi:C4-dicarboxylate-specific signal transduction histidine kinase